MELTFSEVANGLARLHGIHATRLSAFNGRLQHMQRMGFPAGINTGKGRRATYNVSHVLLLALAIELCQLGATPDRAKRVIETRQVGVREAFRLAVHAQGSDRETNGPIVVSIDPNVMQYLVSPIEDDLWLTGSFRYGRLSEVVQLYDQSAKSGMVRAALVSISDLILHLAYELGETNDQREDFFDAVLEWADTDLAE